MKIRNEITILIVIFLSTFSSCQYAPYAHKYTTEKPENIELIGTYVFKKQSVDYERVNYTNENGNKVIPKIIIKKNGKFETENLPFYKNWKAEYVGLLSKKGNWNITSAGYVGTENDVTLEHWGINLNGLPTEMEIATLMNKNKPYDLIFIFGDPDEGNVMIFEKTNEKL